VLFVECIAATLGRRDDVAPDPGDSATAASAAAAAVAVIVPAHDEQHSIRATIASILPQLKATDRLIVIADNCSDETAGIARRGGAMVIERTDAAHRGKGYALACGIEALRARPPAVVIICDADLEVPPGAISTLTCEVMQYNRPVQSQYILEAQEGAGATEIVSALAFLVKNVVRPRGLDRLGLPVPLTGTGMAFPWAAISDAPLASGDLVEDMRLGVYLLRKGFGAKLCRSITIRGSLPTSESAAMQQRTRWEHGHLSVLLSASLPLFVEGIRRGDNKKIFAALDYSVPPIALLVVLLAATTVGSFGMGLKYGAWGSMKLNATAGIMLASSILLAWRAYGRHLRLSALLCFPFYVLWKLPVYAKFLFARQTAWVRTARTKG
jgi:cellulose synthase/poly-beta-1,6-N-acetylglucosamine synthase-like glycosyltransferase